MVATSLGYGGIAVGHEDDTTGTVAKILFLHSKDLRRGGIEELLRGS